MKLILLKNELKVFNVLNQIIMKNTELGENLKNLIKQLEQILRFKILLKDQTKNIIKDTKVNNFILRYQV